MNKGIRRQEGKIVIVDEEKAEFHSLISTLPAYKRKRLLEVYFDRYKDDI